MVIPINGSHLSVGNLGLNPKIDNTKVYRLKFDGNKILFCSDGDANSEYSEATPDARGLMSASDKSKLDKIQNFYKLTIDTSEWDGVGSMPSVTARVDDMNKFAGINYGDRIRICSSEDFERYGYAFNPNKIAHTIVVNIGETPYTLRCVNPSDFNNNSLIGAGFSDFQLGDDDYSIYNVLYKFGGYIDAIIVDWDINVSNGYLYVPIYNSHRGYVSRASKKADTADTANYANYSNVVFAICNDAVGSSTKAASVIGNTNFQLVTGAVAYVRFTNSNTSATIILNVGNTGSKYVRYGGSACNNKNTYYPSWSDGDMVPFVYDGSHWNIVAPTITKKTNPNI
jgi:hypothetical protein